MLTSSVGFDRGLGTFFRGLGKVAQAQGRHQEAVAMFRKSLDTFTERGGSWSMARLLAKRQESILALENEDEARHVRHESMRIATEIYASPGALEVLTIDY